MDVTIHWRDADSFSAKAVREIFPEAEIMLCGGHAGKKFCKNVRKIKFYHVDKYKVCGVSQEWMWLS